MIEIGHNLQHEIESGMLLSAMVAPRNNQDS